MLPWVKVAFNLGKPKNNRTFDLLRIPEKYRKYRYANISQLLEAGQFCRYVGVIKGFKSD
jgi:hypothetical protein